MLVLKMIVFLFLVFVLALLYLLFSRQVLSTQPKKTRFRKPVSSLSEDDCIYNVKSLNAPRASGLSFKLLIRLLYTRFGKNVIFPHFMRKSGLTLFDGALLPEAPTFEPLVNCEASSVGNDASSNEEEIDKLMKLDAKRSSDRPITIADYVEGYRSQKFTPLQVCM